MSETTHQRGPGILPVVREILSLGLNKEPSRKVLIAVSGGADSICLLHAVSQFADSIGVKPHVVHVNHGTRISAQRDQDYVHQIATEWCVPIHCYRAEPRNTSESELRRVRYELFRKAAAESGCSTIALAHNQDDLVETLLMNMLRGTGLHGFHFSPAQKLDNLTLLRPLWQIPRSVILQYLRDNGVGYCCDESNDALEPTRNRIRHVLLPLLETDFNPQVRDALARCATVLSGTDEYMQSIAEIQLECCRRSLRRTDALPLQWLMRRKDALRNAILRTWIRHALPEHTVSYEHLEQINHLIVTRQSRHVALPGRNAVVCTPRAIWLYIARFYPQCTSGEEDAEFAFAHCRSFGSLIARVAGPVQFSENVVRIGLLDSRKLVLRITGNHANVWTVRNRVAGDRLVSGGSLKEALINDKVPAYIRDYLICIINCDGEVVHVVGLPRINGRVLKKLGKKALSVDAYVDDMME